MIQLSRYAPESIKVPPEFIHKSDVWSFGVTLWEILSLGEIPKYLDIDNNKPSELLSAYRAGKRLPRPEKGVLFTKELWEFMQLCWTYTSELRPIFNELNSKIKAVQNNFNNFSTPENHSIRLESYIFIE